MKLTRTTIFSAIGFIGGAMVCGLLIWPTTTEASDPSANCTWTSCAGSTVQFVTSSGSASLSVSTPHWGPGAFPDDCENAGGDTVHVELDGSEENIIVYGTCGGTITPGSEELECSSGDKSCSAGSRNCDDNGLWCWAWDIVNSSQSGDVDFSGEVEYQPS